MATKDKFSFSIDGVKYTDIKGSDNIGNNKLYIGVAGTAQMIRQWMKQKYPQLPLRNYYFISSSSFANGNSIDVYLNDAPDDIYSNIKGELTDKFEYGSYHYGLKQGGAGIKYKTDQGENINYGTKYLSVNNRPPYGTNAPAVDWDILQNTAPAKATKQFQSKSAKSTFDKGDLLMDCAGWEVYKKKYADGKILYTAHKKPATPQNKIDWDTIKGEIYTQTGFSYSRFGNFQKWGQIASEAYIINLLCTILGKYYKDPTMASVATPSAPATTISPDESKDARFYAQYLIIGYDKIWEQLNITSGSQLKGDENLQKQFADKFSKFYSGFIQTYPNISDYQKRVIVDEFEKVNAFTLENVLALKGFFGVNTQQSWLELYENSAPNMYLNPEYFGHSKKGSTQSGAKKQSKEDIEKIIKGLEVLSRLGNKDADQKIKGYKIILKLKQD